MKHLRIFAVRPLPRRQDRAIQRAATTVAGILLLLLAIVSSANAQTTGRIVGRVIDDETGRGLVGAQITVTGTAIGVVAGIDGRYSIPNAPVGSVGVTASLLGYSTRTVTEVSVPASGGANLDIALTAAALAVEGITVSLSADQGAIGRALDRQRNSVAVVSEVTSEQISRSPDSDAAAAVQRVSGVSVQDGKFVFVRGLGERYTTTSLNGSRIPSPEPERKMVPLDLFPSGLVQSITTAKTFTPNLYGDFSGAQVDIQTREFPTRRQVTYSYSIGFNPDVTAKTQTVAPAAGGEWIAYATSPRRMPTGLANRTSFEGIRQADYNNIVRSFRNSWSVEQRTALPSSSMAMSVGGNDPFLGQRVGYLASMTYSINEEARLDQVRAIALPGSAGETYEVSRYEGNLGRTSVLWGGLLNLSTMFGTDSRVSLNASYNRSADNDGRRERGVDESTAADLRIDRLQYVERSVATGQLQGEHQIGPRHRFDWSASSSVVRRQEPDRSEVVYVIERNAAGQELPPAWALTGNEVAVRTFADLQENAYEGRVNYRLSIGTPNRPFDAVFGAAIRNTRRDADNRAWSVQSIGNNPLTRDRWLREQDPEAIFGEAFTDPEDAVFSVLPIAQGGSYKANDRLYAGYGMIEANLTRSLQVITGARLERSELELEALSTLKAPYTAKPSYTDVLPALTLNLNAWNDHNFRFSLSQTLARPEYREVAPIQYREVIGGENTRGNADLRRTLIRNVDFRWEMYPAAEEVMSVALFAKWLQDPIERIYPATSGTAINTFVNAEGARNYGVELEFRKGLGFIHETLSPFGVFANSTIMDSRITIGNEGLASTTNPNRPMLGQAPYVVNTGLTYANSGSAFSSTLLFNRVGKRIVAAAGAPLPDVYELANSSMDLAFRFPLVGSLSGKVDLKNLLDSPDQIQQGTVTREYYRSGRSISLGITHRR